MDGWRRSISHVCTMFSEFVLFHLIFVATETICELKGALTVSTYPVPITCD